MTKLLPLSDFRAVRRVLEEHEYLTGGEEVAPTGLIEPAVWHGIMDLADDVAIRISNHHGTRLSAQDAACLIPAGWVMLGEAESPTGR